MVDAPSHGRVTAGAASAEHRHDTHVTKGRLGAAGLELLVAYAVLTALWVGMGLLITGPLAESWIVRVDVDAADWFVERRTSTWDTWSHYGGMLADTLVKIIVTAIIAGLMLAIWRSWREPFLIAAALVLEASVFITVTWIVGRPRPDVVRLDESPVGSSFPSGHVAAAAAYAAIAIVIFERTRNVWIRVVTVVVTVAVPVIVAFSRMYRGMHYVSDVVAGAVLGVACVVVVYVIVRRTFERPVTA